MRARLIVFVIAVYGVLLSTLIVPDPRWRLALFAVGGVAGVIAGIILLVDPVECRRRRARRPR